jgi:multicomponent Na+:H+ antiporter subunit E
VVYRVFHPKMPINPGIVKVRTNLKSKSGRVILCNSITLTPGTLSVDIDKDGYIYIHWINVMSQDIEEASKLIVVNFEKILMRIFE